MSKNESIKKDLFILGNGFDLALNLRSDFSTYIEEENNGRNYNKVLHFIGMFNKYTMELMLLSHPIMLWHLLRPLEMRKHSRYFYTFQGFNLLRHKDIYQRLKLLKKLLPSSRRYKYIKRFFVQEHVRIRSESIDDEMSDFFNVKLALLNNKYRYWLSKRNDIGSKLDLQFNKLADKWFLKLIRLAKSINNINFWDLIIIFQKEYSDRKYHKSFNDWCDIEDTIKYFLTSLYNEPKYKNGHFHVSKLNYYFNDTNEFF